jgi:hypothetical protein
VDEQCGAAGTVINAGNANALGIMKEAMKHMGLRWGFIFLSGKSSLIDSERLKVVGMAADMYFNGEKERKISIDGYRGLLSTNQEWSVLGCFSGQVFYAELWPEDGEEKTRLRFLISEQTFGTGNTHSMN